jgi:HprK-related kinase A
MPRATEHRALSSRGYRLLSDEFAAVRLGDGELLPALRPIALKNESIEVIRRFAPRARLGPLYPGTRKGDVVHAAPDAASVAARATPAVPGLVVFPRYESGAATALRPFSRAQAFARLGVNSFNYAELGPFGFDAVRGLVERCECYRLVYTSLEEAIRIIDGLVDRIASGGTLRDVPGGGQSVESGDAFRGVSNTATP